MFHSYAAIGDSFTEGVGDELPDGTVRGWADFVALGLAEHAAALADELAHQLDLAGDVLRSLETEATDYEGERGVVVSLARGGPDLDFPPEGDGRSRHFLGEGRDPAFGGSELVGEDQDWRLGSGLNHDSSR